MRAESRTFDPARFRRNLYLAQIVYLTGITALWIIFRGQPILHLAVTDPGGLIWRLAAVVAGYYGSLLCREGFRYFLFRTCCAVDKEYLRFGFSVSGGGGFFCKCIAAIDGGKYRLAAVLSAALAWVPLIVSVAFSHFWLFAVFAFASAGTFYDIAVLWKIRKVPAGSWVQDSPFLPGCEVYLPEDRAKNDSKGD